MIKWIAGVCLFLLIAACQDQNVHQTTIQNGVNNPLLSDTLFDLHSFIDLEIIRLNNEKIQLRKVIYASLNDSITVNQPDWSTEIIVFKTIDTKNPSIRANFSIDTIYTDNMIRIHWESSKENNVIRSLTLTLVDKKIARIEIVKHQSSFLMEQHEFLVYQPLIGYSIQKESKTPFGQSQYLLESNFVYP